VNLQPPATERACLRCGAPTLVGLDDHVAARLATIDPQPLDELGELAAILDGRRTYALERDRRIHQRDRWRVGQRLGLDTVHADHRCRP
jgi:hypothetical protein